MQALARRRAAPLETLWVEVPDDAVGPYEAALRTVCATVGFFLDEATGHWRVEGVREAGAGDPELAGALALAALVSGVTATPARSPVAADGWLARSYAAFPEQPVGRRFAVRGTHLRGPATPGRITLTLDAGLAFGSGEHGSTRGCLRALERVARRHAPARILDLGTGSGILAMAAARLLHRPVLGTDIEPWSVRVAAQNAALNGVGGLARFRLADGWRARPVRAGAPYDLVFANILARPLCRMAKDLAARLAPRGVVILSGLLASQARRVLVAHRRQGLVLAFAPLREGDGADPWTTLVLASRATRPSSSAIQANGRA